MRSLGTRYVLKLRFLGLLLACVFLPTAVAGEEPWKLPTGPTWTRTGGGPSSQTTEWKVAPGWGMFVPGKYDPVKAEKLKESCPDCILEQDVSWSRVPVSYRVPGSSGSPKLIVTCEQLVEIDTSLLPILRKLNPGSLADRESNCAKDDDIVGNIKVKIVVIGDAVRNIRGR